MKILFLFQVNSVIFTAKMSFKAHDITMQRYSEHILFFFVLAGILLPCMDAATQRDMVDAVCKLETRDISGSPANHKSYIAICRDLGLTRVPDDLPNTTVELYLDQNNLTRVPSFAFSGMPRLRVLDLSASNIQKLSNDCFAGLNQLEELYLPFNNIDSPSNIAQGLFLSLSNLRLLHVQGSGNGNYNTWSKEIAEMKSLEALGISYFSDMVFPSELASLPELTILHLSHGNTSRNLTSESLSTLRRGKVQELSFKGNPIEYIEHGSFDDLPELRLLNFACCGSVTLDNIVDVLSNASNTQVESYDGHSTACLTQQRHYVCEIAVPGKASRTAVQE